MCSHTLLFFHSLALNVGIFSILMLFLTDSFDGTIFWLCVMFSSVIFLFIFGSFLLFRFQFSCTLLSSLGKKIKRKND